MNKPAIIENEFGSFADEVLNAGWLPPCLERQETSAATMAARVSQRGVSADEVDIGAFLKLVYANQE